MATVAWRAEVCSQDGAFESGPHDLKDPMRTDKGMMMVFDCSSPACRQARTHIQFVHLAHFVVFAFSCLGVNLHIECCVLLLLCFFIQSIDARSHFDILFGLPLVLAGRCRGF